MFFKKVENGEIVSVVETDYAVTNENFEKISKKEYLEILESIEADKAPTMIVENISPTYSELSEACSILMGGVTE